jgi:5-methyltetrahydropteroyltriglutamate--homocysteine methyltransferase
MITTHADVVGSLLRPPWLLEAQERLGAGQITDQPTRASRIGPLDEAVAQQEEAGLTVVMDGEMRRLSFQSQMVQAIEGFGKWDIGAFLWGDWHGHEEVGDSRRERPKDLGVAAPLRRQRSLSAEEFVYLRARTARTPKGTLPSPGLSVNFWPPERSRGAYASLESFLGDVARILREEVEELAECGASYIQLDAPIIPCCSSPTRARSMKGRAGVLANGWIWASLWTTR